MNKLKFVLYIFFAAVLLTTTGCEDTETAFEPLNPNLSEDAVKGVPNSASNLLLGCERQIALCMNEIVVISEIASDNYQNTQTFFNQFLDRLDIDATDADIEDTQEDFALLRELALSGLNEIGPEDPNFDDQQAAEFNFMAGYAHLLMGMYFKSLPAEPLGAAQSSSTHLQVATGYFDAALSLASENRTITSAHLGNARANYYLGNQSEAVASANAAIASDPEFVRFAQYDAVNGPTNSMQDALWDRATFDDLQPLPTLDFLDPKYNGSDAVNDVDVPILKIEEAHLILAEAAIAGGDLGTAQTTMKDIVALVGTRPTQTFDDSSDGRTQDAPGSRPDNEKVVVSAGGGAPALPGLVINRQMGPVTIPVVSGTSVTDGMIDAVTTEDEALELLYKMRQEIFIAEGIRFVDLGLKLVVHQTEALLNDNITDADQTPEIPSFIEGIRTELDAFTYDIGGESATVTHNLNKIIVANKTSAEVLPFH